MQIAKAVCFFVSFFFEVQNHDKFAEQILSRFEVGRGNDLVKLSANLWFKAQQGEPEKSTCESKCFFQ